MKLPIAEVIIGDRRREDMGDIVGLADSINMWGLLHPIVVDDQKRLVAGERRFRACQSLGWKEIEVKMLSQLTDDDLREIELEENLKRKDLTELEKSKNMVELAELKAHTKARELRAPSARNAGRPTEPNSVRELAKDLGVPPKTLHEARQHVEAVEKYPVLEDLPKKEAIRTAKKLDILPPEDKSTVLQAIKADKPEPEKPKTPEEEESEKQKARAQRFKTEVDRLIDRLHLLSTNSAEFYFEGLDEIEWAFNSAEVFARNQLSIIDDAIKWLTDYRAEFAKRLLKEIAPIRRVK